MENSTNLICIMVAILCLSFMSGKSNKARVEKKWTPHHVSMPMVTPTIVDGKTAEMVTKI